MKKLNLFLSLILILVMGTAASAQTVDDVISKATVAMGGQSAIDAVKSLRMKMTGTLMDKEIEMEVVVEGLLPLKAWTIDEMQNYIDETTK